MPGPVQHPIFALWAHPRSLSTATERIMRERGDLECLHEPFLYYYYVHSNQRKFAHFDEDRHPHPLDFEDIIAHLRQKARTRPVFFKDMGYYVLPTIYQYAAFARQLRHLFLVRDPRKSILSYHKLDPDFSCDEVGVAAQWTLFEWLRDIHPQTPLVIEAETLQTNPLATMAVTWDYLALPMAGHAFKWQQKPLPADWQAVADWHDTAQSSTGIIRSDPQDEARTRAAFSSRVHAFPHLGDYLEHHWPFYQKLKSVSRAQFPAIAPESAQSTGPAPATGR